MKLRPEEGEVGYLDNGGSFGLTSTDPNPQLGGNAAQFYIFDVTPGDYVLEQTGDGKLTRVPVRAGEYTYAGVTGISTTPISISGTVRDEYGGNVAGVTVRILGTGIWTASAFDGSYTLSGVPARSRVAVSVSNQLASCRATESRSDSAVRQKRSGSTGQSSMVRRS